MTEKMPKDIRMKQIIQAAIAEFHENGYAKATMDKIAARAGLTKGAVYYHFKNKDDILVGINQDFEECIAQIIADSLGRPTPSAGLRHYIREYLNYWMTHPLEIEIFLISVSRAIENPELWPAIKSFYASEAEFFETTYQAGVEKGEFPAQDFQSLAIALISALEGAIAYLTAGGSVSLDRLISMLENTFIRTVSIERE
ncbi:MAG: TetR/AcrR family transcriptional regulator [Deltaproteobacteria bacterium]|nr:TetR/AcrR family transcriptional regulator [Deltaproteobacteria bacterium]